MTTKTLIVARLNGLLLGTWPTSTARRTVEAEVRAIPGLRGHVMLRREECLLGPSGEILGN
jgi:hypothetical protein